MAQENNHTSIDTAVVIAAGWGTRALPYSKAVSKEMAEVAGVPLVDHIVGGLAEIGIRNVVIVVNAEMDANGANVQEAQLRRWFEQSPALEQHLRDTGKAQLIPLLARERGLNLDYIVQPNDGRYGTAAPLHAATDALIGVKHFMVVNGDDLLYSKNQESPFGLFASDVAAAGTTHGLMVERMPRLDSGVYPYGIVAADSTGRMIGFVEKPDASQVLSRPLRNCGKYIFGPSVLELCGEYMESTRDQRKQEEYYLTDVLKMLMIAGEPVTVHETRAQFLDVGDSVQRIIATLIIRGCSEQTVARVWNELRGLS